MTSRFHFITKCCCLYYILFVLLFALSIAGSFPDLSLKKETDILCADTHQFIHAHFRESEVCILSGNYY